LTLTRNRSLAPALELIDKALNPTLVADPARQALVRLAARLPDVGGAQYLECRLGPNSNRSVDLLLSVTKFQRDDLLRSYANDVLLEGGMSACRRLLECWSRETTLLNESVPVAWLEFDDVEHQEALKANVCVSVVPSYIDPYAPVVSHPASDLLTLLLESVSAIRETPCTAAEEDALVKSVEHLPSGAHWIHLSVMTARHPSQLKLYGVFPAASLPNYLEALGWRGDLDELCRSFERYGRPEQVGPSVYVDLSITELACASRGSIGLCFSQQQLRLVSLDRADRRELLRSLCDEGLVTRDEVDALCAWPLKLDLNVTGRAVQLSRWLDIKLVHLAGGGRLAKAYLGFAGSTTEFMQSG
jgi:hypothetical protein